MGGLINNLETTRITLCLGGNHGLRINADGAERTDQYVLSPQLLQSS